MSAIQILTKSVTISPGESFTLPSGATIISITDTLTNSCNFELPTPEQLIEYNFYFSVNEDNNDDHPMGSEVNIESILIDGVLVPLSFTFFNTASTGNSFGISVWNTQVTTNNNLLSSYPVKFQNIVYSAGTSKSDLVTATIKMPESYLNKVFLVVRNDKFPNNLYLKGSI